MYKRRSEIVRKSQKNDHSLVSNTEATLGVWLHLEKMKNIPYYCALIALIRILDRGCYLTLFSVDQKTLSPMAEIFLLCGNVYLERNVLISLLVPFQSTTHLSFGQNQGSALSR